MVFASMAGLSTQIKVERIVSELKPAGTEAARISVRVGLDMPA